MKLRFIHRILIVVTMALFLVPDVVAQGSVDDYEVVAIKGINRIYSLPENPDITFCWSYKDEDGAIIPITGSSNEITLAFPEPGKYILSVYGKDATSGCFSESTELKIKVLDAGFDVELGKARWICSGDTIEISAQIHESHIDGKYDELTYEWDGRDEKTPSIKVWESGTYGITVTDKYGNSVNDYVNIDVYPAPFVDLGDDIVKKKSSTVVLSTGDSFQKYVWSTGAEGDKIEVRKHGKYWLTVTDINKCTASDTIRIFYKGESTESGLVASVPTAFSPNNDGVNDKLMIRGDLSRIKSSTFIVYRKDGLKVFESSNINEGWNGKYKGEDQAIDGYIYFLKIVFDTDEVLTKKGSISLLR